MSNKSIYDAAYRDRSYDVASVYDHIIRIRQRYFAGMSGRALDHGFGNGVIARYLEREGFEPFGVETSSVAVDAMADPRFVLIDEADSRLPFDDGRFSVIVSNQVLYFLPSREQIDLCVREFARVLEPGGRVACTIMAPENYWFAKHGAPLGNGMVRVTVRGRLTRDFTLYRFESEQAVRACFESAGLIVDDLGYFDFRLLDVDCAKHWIVLARKP